MKKQKKLPLFRRLLHHLKAALLRDVGLKLLCLTSALFLVAYQRSQSDEKTRTVAFNLDAQLPGPTRKRELLTTLPPNVRVTLQGSARALEELATSTPNVEVDLRDGKTSHLRLLPELFDLPPGVGIKAIDPPTLELEWQDVVTRFVPVQSTVMGTVGEGLEVAGVTVEPDVVELNGPESLVRVAQYARVASFDVSGLGSGTFKRTLALDAPANRTNYAGRTSVVVSVEVRRRLVSISFARLSVEVVGQPNAVVTPSKVDVIVRGAPEVIRSLAPDLVVPRVDLGSVDPSKHGSAVAGVTVDLSNATAEVQPPSVKVTW